MRLNIKKALKLKTQLKYFSYFITFYLTFMLSLTGLININTFIKDPVQTYPLAKITINNKHNTPSMKEYILNEFSKAGLNPLDADCLIKHESGYNQYATNWNTNGTIDYGIFMINSIHKNTISVKDRYDYKTATAWTIKKRLHDGNYNAWYGYLNNCI